MTQPRRSPSQFVSVAARRVLVDSGAYLALLDQDDQHHRDATTILDDLITRRYRQFTTNAVLFEAHALILSHIGIAQAGLFIRSLRRSDTVIVRVSTGDEGRAEEILSRYTDRDFSFTDTLSFAVMEHLHIAQAFAFDRHFYQYGFSRAGID